MEKKSLKLAVDAMGGDFAPIAIIDGAVAAAREDGLSCILIGQEQLIRKHLASIGAIDLLSLGLLQIVHADETIDMDEKAALSARTKKNSSLRIACELVKNKEACALLSAGNSGAVMAVSLLVIGRIKGIHRPAIATMLPKIDGRTLVLDAGANIECTPEYLLQFAHMGSLYMQHIFGVTAPKVALLSNGAESTKGTMLTRAALELLKNSSLNFVGYCEGRDLFSSAIDVVVCDGFSGNVLLKTAEGTASFLFTLIKHCYAEQGLMAKLGAWFSASVFQHVKKNVDPREFGAAPLLGLKAPIFIAHGSSDAHAIRCAIVRIQQHAHTDFVQAIAQEF